MGQAILLVSTEGCPAASMSIATLANPLSDEHLSTGRTKGVTKIASETHVRSSLQITPNEPAHVSRVFLQARVPVISSAGCI